MTKKTILGVAMAALVLVSCGKNQQHAPQSKHPLMKVEAQNVQLESLYSASIQGKQDIQILPQVAGFITKLCVQEGQTVKAGQTLFIIDQVNFQAALRVAEANVKAAEALVATQELTYSSKQKLFADKVISQYDLQVAENALLTAKAQLAQAEASVTNAKQNLSYTVVSAPCNGVVGRLPFRVGSLVSPQMMEPLTTISDNSAMYVYFSMTERQMLDLVRQYGSVEKAIRQMPNVQLQLADGSVYSHEGRIESISGVIDRTTGAVSVRAVFENPERLLLSGGSCNVSIPYNRENVIVIPQAATYEIQNKTFCYKNVNGKAQSTIITVSPIHNGKEYIVESGLALGDEIIKEGAGLVREGDAL